MKRNRKPPALLGRTLAFTFVTAAMLLGAVFGVVLLTVRDQVRETIREHLESSQRMFAAIESREQRERRLQAETVAESPTLKAAIDTFAAEGHSGDRAVLTQLFNTISGELAKVAARVDVDAVIVTDGRQRVLAASGGFGNRFRAGDAITIDVESMTQNSSDGIARVGDEVFRMVAAPLLFSDGSTIGSLYLATSLDREFARRLSDLAHADIVIASRGRMVASTLPDAAEKAAATALTAATSAEGTVELDDDSHAFRRLIQTGDTSFYALASIDKSARVTLGSTTRSLAFIALGAVCLALLGSIWLAHRLSEPIGRLSASVHAVAQSRRFDARLPMTGSSLELDRLTETFNDLMASVAAAEAETETAYTAAIRALAATLDARDPYTAGQFERVSALSVSIGRAMRLPDAELEVIRLGALLHDIGKIGVPDDVLRKPGPLNEDELDIIKQHPGLGARILRTVPFLAPHIPIVELHHERPDGRGYPHGLTGDAIPLGAHIVHVADAYDAMTSARAYRPERPAGTALHEIWDGSGTDFHSGVVAVLDAALAHYNMPDRTRDQELIKVRKVTCLSAFLMLGVAISAGAQSVERVAVDSAVSVSQFAGENATGSPDIVIDVTAAVRIGHGWNAYVRPWFRQPSTIPHDWDTTIYTAALQYERAGRIATRVDLGYILSPIGIGMLDMRPDANPLIMPHLAYLVPMPSFDAGVPAALPVASSYPLGGQLTASTNVWDARAAILTTPPNRRYVLYASTPNPPTRPMFVVGGGVTPRTGLRVGVGYATGAYATAGEVQAPASGARTLHMFSAETEFAFGYTKLSGEITHDLLETATGQANVTEWFVQGMQTLSPRWFTAARYEGVNAVPRANGDRPTLRVSEGAIGFRLSNDFTVRGSYTSRKTYFTAEADRQVAYPSFVHVGGDNSIHNLQFEFTIRRN